MDPPLLDLEQTSASSGGWMDAEGTGGGGTYLQAHQRSIRPVLDTLDRVAPYLEHESGVETPSIVVIGDQSTGKTSVLEAISGVALPRGQGIVTRCPAKLILRNGPNRAVIKYKRPGSDVHDEAAWHEEEVGLEGVGDAVIRATDALAGSNKGIVDELIYLEVTQPGCPDLTIIDLPGITRVPVGDQPENIGQQVKSLISKYIPGDAKVLLCMVPADQDFATAEAFLLAQEVDPQGRRTLGVVTKIDKAEPGIRAKLEGTGKGNVHLDLGFVGVRCRKPEELTAGLSEADVRQLERDFIHSHPELKQMPPGCLGLSALVDKLCSLQLRVIHTTLPKMKKQVHDKKCRVEGELAALPTIITTEQEALMTCNNLLNEVERTFTDLSARGDLRALEGASEADRQTLVVAARVLEMAEAYYVEVREGVDVQRFLGDDFLGVLRDMMRDARGVGLSNFLSHPIFERAYIHEVHSKLLSPSQDLVAELRGYVEGVFELLLRRSFKDHQGVMELLRGEVSEFLSEQEATAAQQVAQIVQAEEHIMELSTQYDDKIGRMEAALASIQAAMKEGLTKWEDVLHKIKGSCPDNFADAVERLLETEDMGEATLIRMQMSLVAYAGVVLERVCDVVAKGARNLLVSQAGKNLYKTVARRLPASTGPHGLLPYMHDPQLAARRARLQSSLENLTSAWKELKAIPAVV